MPVLIPKSLVANRCEAITAYHRACGLPHAQLDVSGGIDSAVMLMLLTRALGAGNVTAVYSCINSSDESRSRARMAAQAAGASLCEVEATEAYTALVSAALTAVDGAGLGGAELVERLVSDPTVYGSLRSTLRAPLGRFINRMMGGGIRHGTGNEDEDRWLRFYQKGGDGEVDTNPLAMLSKGEVYQLAVELEVPTEIIDCMPTPDLWGTGDSHNDEAELRRSSGVDWTYSRVDSSTGDYVKVGTIERLSRLLDTPIPGTGTPPLFGEDLLFAGRDPQHLSIVHNYAAANGLSVEHCASAAKWERGTRHKMNPNCPAIGTGGRLAETTEIRRDLLAAGILTDTLPQA